MVLLLSHQQRRPRITLELKHHQVFFCKTELLQRAIRATFFDRSLVYKKTKSSEEKRVIGCTIGGRTCIVFMGSHEVMKSLQKRVQYVRASWLMMCLRKSGNIPETSNGGNSHDDVIKKFPTSSSHFVHSTSMTVTASAATERLLQLQYNAYLHFLRTLTCGIKARCLKITA
jgi:hypothetical protein